MYGNNEPPPGIPPRWDYGGDVYSLRPYRFLLTPRWLVLLVLAALSVPGCLMLAGWQFDRLGGAQQVNDRIERNSSAAPAPVAELAPVGGSITPDIEWRSVTASGRYDVENELFVRNRPRDGRQGFQVLTPLVTDGEPAVLVNRGSVAAPPSGGSPQAPDTPTGPVTVTGHLRPTETGVPTGTTGLPAGQILGIDVPRLAAELPYDVRAGYVQLAAQDPAPPVVAGAAVPNPLEVPGSTSELLHRSYAWQWYIFAAIGPIGVALLARREAADRGRAQAGASSAASTPEIGARSNAAANGS